MPTTFRHYGGGKFTERTTACMLTTDSLGKSNYLTAPNAATAATVPGLCVRADKGEWSWPSGRLRTLR